jgi:hypothetical protein
MSVGLNDWWDFFSWGHELIGKLPQEQKHQFFKMVSERDPETFQDWLEFVG